MSTVLLVIYPIFKKNSRLKTRIYKQPVLKCYGRVQTIPNYAKALYYSDKEAMLSKIDIHFSITPFFLFSLFLFFFALWIIFTIILRYHWKNYSVSKLEILRMDVIYFTGSILIILGLLCFLIAYIMMI